jgi:hypothetical protein
MTYATRTIESMRLSAQPDLSTIKSKMKATWEDGDYADFATYMEPGAVEILEDWNITPGQRLLEVGCSTPWTKMHSGG